MMAFTREEACSYGTGSPTARTQGRGAPPGEGFAETFLRRPPELAAVPDAQSHSAGVHARRRRGTRGATRLLPDIVTFSFHTRAVLATRHLRQRATRLGPARVLSADHASPGLRPHTDVHETHPQRQAGSTWAVVVRGSVHDLVSIRRVLSPDKRPQPRLRCAGNAAFLEG